MSYKITASEKALLQELQINEHISKMKTYPHHGEVTVFDHSEHVVITSLKIADLLCLSEQQKKNIIIGGMLHDFFLYDWHKGRIRTEGIHCWLHPKVALKNASALFDLNNNQKNIIRSHMFPATLLHPPTCAEAWIVSLADKLCAILEYFNTRSKNT